MLSFIIPAHDEELLLGATLGSLHAAAVLIGASYEVVVVDDASTDSTASIAAANGARVISVNHRKIGAARNAGAQHATGALLIFVDADTIVTEAILRSVVRAVRDGAIGGAARVAFEGDMPVFARLMTGLWTLLQPVARLGTGCFFFCTRDAFQAAGRFDETLYALEDLELSRRLHRLGRFVILGEAIVTSGRNLRAHSTLDALRMLAGVICEGRGFLKRREGLNFWYGERPTSSRSPTRDR